MTGYPMPYETPCRIKCTRLHLVAGYLVASGCMTGYPMTYCISPAILLEKIDNFALSNICFVCKDFAINSPKLDMGCLRPQLGPDFCWPNFGVFVGADEIPWRFGLRLPWSKPFLPRWNGHGGSWFTGKIREWVEQFFGGLQLQFILICFSISY